MEKNKITKIAVFDFDGTLVDTPLPEAGKAIYEQKTGREWPHKGWWGRAESLDHEIFDMPLIEQTMVFYNEFFAKPDTLTVMMTGRMQQLSSFVEIILLKHGLMFDRYVYNRGGATIDSKIKSLNDLLLEFKNVNTITILEDRDEHIPVFKAWGACQQLSFEIVHIQPVVS